MQPRSGAKFRGHLPQFVVFLLCPGLVLQSTTADLRVCGFLRAPVLMAWVIMDVVERVERAAEIVGDARDPDEVPMGGRRLPIVKVYWVVCVVEIVFHSNY